VSTLPPVRDGAAAWFAWFIKYISGGLRGGFIQFDIRSHLCDVWRWAMDTGLDPGQRDAMVSALERASVKEQEEAWRLVESEEAFFGGAVPLVKFQMARAGDFPFLTDWESLKPFRSLANDGFRDAGVFAVAVSSESGSDTRPVVDALGQECTTKLRASAFLLAVVAVRSEGAARTRVPRIHAVGLTPHEDTAQVSRDAASAPREFFGFRGLLLVFEYVIRCDFLFRSLPRAFRIIFSALKRRRILEESDFYILTDELFPPEIGGQSLRASVFAAILLSLFLSSEDVKLWLAMFPHLSGSGFSGHMDNWNSVPIGAVPEKIAAFRKKGVSRIFMAHPAKGLDVPDEPGVEFCKSSRELLRRLMAPQWVWLFVNCLFVVATYLVPAWAIRTYWPVPGIESVIGEDATEDANKILVGGAPMRVRSGSVVSLRVDAGRSASETQVLVRAARIGIDGERVRVLRFTNYDLRPARNEVKLNLRDGMATFVYSTEEPNLQNDVLEVGLFSKGRLLSWYPLNLLVARATQ
jgi:hypothetical protein